MLNFRWRRNMPSRRLETTSFPFARALYVVDLCGSRYRSHTIRNLWNPVGSGRWVRSIYDDQPHWRGGNFGRGSWMKGTMEKKKSLCMSPMSWEGNYAEFAAQNIPRSRSCAILPFRIRDCSAGSFVLRRYLVVDIIKSCQGIVRSHSRLYLTWWEG